MKEEKWVIEFNGDGFKGRHKVLVHALQERCVSTFTLGTLFKLLDYATYEVLYEGFAKGEWISPRDHGNMYCMYTVVEYIFLMLSLDYPATEWYPEAEV